MGLHFDGFGVELKSLYLVFFMSNIGDKNLAMNEILRVLKDQGYLIIIELTEEGVNLIRNRHINHPDAINPNDFTKKFDLDVIIKKSKYLRAYIYKRH